ncbi:MAG: hypothetical protein ACTSXF_08285 [Promethearchaeota archaeon]
MSRDLGSLEDDKGVYLNNNIEENNHHTSIRDILFKEELFYPAVLFIIFYAIILFQNWNDLLLLFIPIITFAFFIFYRSIYLLKNNGNERNKDDSGLSQHNDLPVNILYNPLGDERKISDRLYFFLILELLVLMVTGYESLFRPQLIKNYSVYYILLLLIVFIYAGYKSFHDIGFDAKIAILIRNEFIEDIYDLTYSDTTEEPSSYEKDQNQNNLNNDYAEGNEGSNINYTNMPANKIETQNNLEHLEQILSALKIKDFNTLDTIMKVSFIGMFLIWVVIGFFSIYSIGGPQLQIYLPGSRFSEGSSVGISWLVYLIIIFVPLIDVILIKKVYGLLHEIDFDELNQTLLKFPEHKAKIIRNIINSALR